MTCESSPDSSFKSTIILEGESMKRLSRREAMGTIITAGAGVTLAGMTEAAAQTTVAPAFRGQHQPKPLPFELGNIACTSPKCNRIPCTNNLLSGVQVLNTICQPLPSLSCDNDLHAFVYGDLNREELARTGSVVLHEHYFANLGG